ncbi:CoA-binding protein [Candidatus Albibeggiatoa sp. nov. BB20]|uniref:CoA-binding protein n=1 Tax=Candidatus Albibeggiatoa sp. nov. BB20 TaxID=3162723 RepID=UPI003365480C
MSYKVAVLGASPKAERYSNKAVKMLLEYHHEVLPIHPNTDKIHEQTCYKNLESIQQPIHTLALYVGEERSNKILDEILALQPKRIIMNPGTENEQLKKEAEKQGIEVVKGCTLVMLQTQQF